jgi:ABC-type spermidine/putrescine transport system permease subunit I
VSEQSRSIGLPRWFWQAFASPGIFWLLVLFVVPFFAIFAIAMGTRDPIFFAPVPVWNPLEWQTETFRGVLENVFGGGALQTVLLRTTVYVGIASVLSLLIGYPVAYYIARHTTSRTKVLLLILLIAPFWISYLMRMLAWISLLDDNGLVNDVLSRLGLIDAPVNWLNGRPMTVILGLVYGYVPFLILPLFAAIDRIDQSQIEAARDLGASPARTFLRVTLPLSRHGILAGTVIILLPMFGDYYTQDLMSANPRTSMFANQIVRLIGSRTGGAEGSSLVIVLSLLLVIFMAYYLYSTAKASKEYER